MMRKKALCIIFAIAICSISYILGIELYDTMPCKIEEILEQIETVEEIEYDGVTIKMDGIKYNQALTKIDLQNRNDEMIAQLEHDSQCSKLCQEPHMNSGVTTFTQGTDFMEMVTTNGDEEWRYELRLKEQTDIHQNTYYEFKIDGEKNIKKIDTLRDRAIMQFKEWNVETKESICFKGNIAGKVSKKEEDEITNQLFEHLDAKATNYYEDDREDTTCVYYGYTSWFDEYIQEDNGNKTNLQIGFKYNDELNHTELIIAFPFYNEPF